MPRFSARVVLRRAARIFLTLKRPKNNRAGGVAPGRFRITISHVVLVLAGMLLMGLIQTLLAPQHARVAGTVSTNSAPPAAGAALRAAWGRIEYTHFALDRPQEYFTNEVVEPAETVWTFRNTSKAQLYELFAALELDATARTFLTDSSNWRRTDGGYTMTPPAALIASLSPAARGKLYAVLARSPENVAQRMPFTFRADGFDEWFDQCGLNKEKVRLVRNMTYTRDGNLCFADAAAFSQLATHEETLCLVKTLWRVSTFLMKVRIDSSTDVGALLKYWGRIGPAHTYRPLIESMARLDEGVAINVSYFLPPFARLRLYTYPRPDETNAIREDCFWTAMNFFHEQPDNRFFDPDHIQEVLKTDYIKLTSGEKEFGDVLLLLGRHQQALHMCVYIADEVVFTKNGFNAVQPWVLMKLGEMLAAYEAERPFDLVIYRPRAPDVMASATYSGTGTASRPVPPQ